MAKRTDQPVDGVCNIYMDSWRDFVDFIQNDFVDYRNYIYRGHKKDEWPLLASLDRLNSEQTQNNRDVVLHKFKSASRGRRGLSPKDITDDEWWALGQHHGLKTPLLDWTESPFIASFFAFEKKKSKDELPNNRVVFALEINRTLVKGHEFFEAGLEDGSKHGHQLQIINPNVDDNTRLVSQRGLFTKLGQIDLDIEEWVSHWFAKYEKVVLIKMHITENTGDRIAFLRYLNRMNVNHLSLFPDLEGAAKYCNMEIEIDKY